MIGGREMRECVEDAQTGCFEPLKAFVLVLSTSAIEPPGPTVASDICPFELNQQSTKRPADLKVVPEAPFLLLRGADENTPT